ncbi:hypothetical protein KAU40_00495 [Candidatus Parcubacteria bacterium]|nr:hypothetical protein [Candidatus Parcubacteria bacterium]
MINLLPSQYKKELKQEESLKIIVILGIIILSFLICFCLILFLIKIDISEEITTQKIFIEVKEKEYRISETKNLEKEMLLLNQTLLKLNSFYKEQINLTEALEKIAQILPSKGYLTGFNFMLLNEEYIAGKLSFSGFSPTREILLLFKENLDKQEIFTEIYFPSSNWVKPSDIDFSATLKINNLYDFEKQN